MKTEIARQALEKLFNIVSDEDLFSYSKVVVFVQMDGRTKRYE